MSRPTVSNNATTASSALTVSAALADRTASPDRSFVDRRQTAGDVNPIAERRQFGSAHLDLSEAGRELAVAIDQYKIQHHRRYLTCDEMLKVLGDLGYRKVDA